MKMLLKSIFTNSSGILLSRILGYLRDLMTASILGANIYSDIFFAAFKFPNLFRRIFGEGAFIQAFLPSLIASKHKSLFSAQVFYRFLGVIFVLTLFVNIFQESATAIIAYGFDEATTKIAAPLVAINFWYLDLVFIMTFLGALLQYRHSFFANAYSTGLLNIAMICALFLARDLEQEMIVYYLSFSVLVGGVLQILLHLWSMRGKRLYKPLLLGFFYVFKKQERAKEDTKRFNNQFLPSVLGSSTAQLSAFIDTLLASFLASGAISYLYYSNRIFQLPLALFAIATATALFPTIAKALKNGEEARALMLLKKSFWWLFLLLSCATIVGIYFSHEIVSLLFERGAFGVDDTAHTALALSMYLVGLIPFGLAKIFNLWLYSRGEQMKAAKISAISLGANVIFSLALIGPFGMVGLALAGSLTGFLLFVLTIRVFGWVRFKRLLL